MIKLLKYVFFDERARYIVSRIVSEHLNPYRWQFGLSVVFMLIAACSTTALPYLLQPVFDEVFTTDHLETLMFFCAMVFLAFSFKGISSFGEQVTMAYIGQRIISDLQNRLFNHLMHADMAFFHRTSSGELLSRFTNDISMMRQSVSSLIVGLGKDFFSLIFLIALMFSRDWVLALLCCVIFPLTAIPIGRIGRSMRKVTDQTQAELGRFTTQLTQVFQGVRVVKSYAMEDYEAARAHRAIERIFKFIYKSTRVRCLTHPIVESVGGIAVVAVIAWGGYQVMNENRTTGEFVSFIGALILSYEPLKSLGKLNAALQEGIAAASRVFDILDTHPHIFNTPHATILEKVKGEIEIQNVTFNYPNGKKALENVSLKIPQGKTIALVGPSGAGKSTFINLLPRFYDVTEGSILIDGHDIRQVTLQSLRQHISLVSQEIHLFDDTIYNNIAYGNSKASEEEIIAAAKAAAAHEFIDRLPEKYEAMIGENGVKLSGGQRQRIAIARAMLKNAAIILLDEATSALDTDSERQVQVALKKLMTGHTTIMVAHRLSTVIEADQIYVIDQGHIIEAGNHSELLKEEGLYARLWRAQSERPEAA